MIKIVSKTKFTEVMYLIERDEVSYIYKEWLDERHKVVDFALLGADEEEIDDADLIEEIQQFLDEHDN